MEQIADELETAAPIVAKETQDAKRRAEEERQRIQEEQRERRRKELEELRKKAATSSREQLLAVIESWVTACHIEKFFAELKGAQGQLAEGDRDAVANRIERARALFGGASAIEHFDRWRTPEEHLQTAKRNLWWYRSDDLDS